MRRGPFLSALRLGLGLAAATAFGASAQGVVQPVCGPCEVTLYEFGSLYYRNGQGQRVGIDPEVLEEVARRTGCVFHTRLDSRVRTWALMAANRLDMTVSGVPTPERLLFGEFVPYLSTRNHLIVRRELASRIASLQAFEADASLRVAVVKSFRHGVTLDRWLERLRAAGRVDEYPDAEVVARVFAAGRADAFLAQPITWTPLLERNAMADKVQMLDLAPGDTIVGGLVLSRVGVRPADVERMRAAVAAMRADGSLEAIMARHVGAKVAREVARELTHAP
ncbi:MAG: transporter substrate-binding domain-containing protein [Inhella sp.]|nr:transporter substrate-binding domain-containing protein [Inhella sp.]